MGGGGEGREVSQIVENVRDFVENAMNNKLIDNISVVGENKVELERLKKKFAWKVKEGEVKKLKNRLREEVERDSYNMKLDHKNQVRAIRMAKKDDKRVKFTLPKELGRYRKAKIRVS